MEELDKEELLLAMDDWFLFNLKHDFDDLRMDYERYKQAEKQITELIEREIENEE